jgi:hypothetical protein
MTRSRILRIALALAVTVLVAVGVGAARAATSGAASKAASTTFSLIRSTGVVAAHCLGQAKATVTVTNHGATETMTVDATGLVPDSEFDLFIIQVPNAPFGIAWYQGDLDSDSTGAAHHNYVGRFSLETFAVAPGTAVAPDTHDGIDATTNPAFAPIHTYHVGLWFGSPAVATAAGCPATVTPFNGDHNAGIQAMSTRQFADTSGPLHRLA